MGTSHDDTVPIVLVSTICIDVTITERKKSAFARITRTTAWTLSGDDEPESGLRTKGREERIKGAEERGQSSWKKKKEAQRLGREGMIRGKENPGRDEGNTKLSARSGRALKPVIWGPRFFRRNRGRRGAAAGARFREEARPPRVMRKEDRDAVARDAPTYSRDGARTRARVCGENETHAAKMHRAPPTHAGCREPREDGIQIIETRPADWHSRAARAAEDEAETELSNERRARSAVTRTELNQNSAQKNTLLRCAVIHA